MIVTLYTCVIEPFPFRLEYESMDTPMWVRLNVTDGESERTGGATPGAEVHVATGKDGFLTVSRMYGSIPPFELMFDADEYSIARRPPDRHSYWFWPHIERGTRDSAHPPPTVVSLALMERTWTYPYWQRLRKNLRTNWFGMRGLRML
jgi:hypothetical protein